MGKFTKVLIIVLVLAGLGYLAYYQFAAWHSKKVEEATQREKERWVEETSQLEEKITKLQDELREGEDSLPEEKLLETFGEKPTLPTTEGEEIDCEELERQILAFFSYLDKKKYVESYNWKGGTHIWFQNVIDKVSRNLPVVSGETKDLYGLLKNTAHFFRILGEKRVKFVADTLIHESDVIEPTLALFYEWFISGDRCKDNLKIRPSGKTLYRYAGFFLNTLAGRSYLLRRGAKVRTLVSYYSILIIHRANERRENEYGIDIRPYLSTLLDNISNQRGLAYRTHYLRKLEELGEKYEMK